LKQTPRAWYDSLTKTVVAFGFVQGKCDRGGFTKIPVLEFTCWYLLMILLSRKILILLFKTLFLGWILCLS